MQDFSDRLKSLVILVVLNISQVVQRAWICHLAVGEREVDGDAQVDVAAAEDVFQEVDSPSLLVFLNLNFAIFEAHWTLALELIQRRVGRPEILVVT